MIECAECGHLHFDPKRVAYVTCPLADEGCMCLDDDAPPGPEYWQQFDATIEEIIEHVRRKP